jgi:hypothetical protein
MGPATISRPTTRITPASSGEVSASSKRSSAAAAARTGLDRLRQDQSCHPNNADRETGFHVMRLPRGLIFINPRNKWKEKSAG